MNSPNAFENSKESTFSALRRGCLDLRKSVELLDSDEFSPEIIRYAWLFLMELSKAKLRRKHALECINIMLVSPKWAAILHNTDEIQSKLPNLSKDMQIAFGYSQAGASPDVKPAPTTANIAFVRKASVLPVSVPLVRGKSSKLKRGSGSAIVIKAVVEPDAAPEPVLAIEHPVYMSQPGELHINVGDELQNNPFRMDYNPFKEARGVKLRSNPHSFKNKPSEWWGQSQSPVDTWWDNPR